MLSRTGPTTPFPAVFTRPPESLICAIAWAALVPVPPRSRYRLPEMGARTGAPLTEPNPDGSARIQRTRVIFTDRVAVAWLHTASLAVTVTETLPSPFESEENVTREGLMVNSNRPWGLYAATQLGWPGMAQVADPAATLSPLPPELTWSSAV